MKVKGWCRCGGPLWREDGCQLCRLEAEAQWADRMQVDERRGWSPIADMGAPTPSADFHDRRPTSQWLPPGQRDVKPARSKTERACQFWLRDVQERQDWEEWRRCGRRYLNATTFMDLLARIRDAGPWPVPDRSEPWSSPWDGMPWDGISPEQRVLDAFQGHPRRQM
jgi:hypothetical protein